MFRQPRQQPNQPPHLLPNPQPIIPSVHSRNVRLGTTARCDGSAVPTSLPTPPSGRWRSRARATTARKTRTYLWAAAPSRTPLTPSAPGKTGTKTQKSLCFDKDHFLPPRMTTSLSSLSMEDRDSWEAGQLGVHFRPDKIFQLHMSGPVRSAEVPVRGSRCLKLSSGSRHT